VFINNNNRMLHCCFSGIYLPERRGVNIVIFLNQL
jgi:hypothetical protein